MVELIYAGNQFEFEEYKRMYNKTDSEVKFVSDPNSLMHVASGAVVKPVGSYQRRMDYGQTFEICTRRKLIFHG